MSQSAPTLVCFCFGHDDLALAAAARDGTLDDIVVDITARCRRGESDCANKNPAGRCCLGEVRGFGRAANGASCCAPKGEPADDDAGCCG